jgi:hypothetical protein
MKYFEKEIDTISQFHEIKKTEKINKEKEFTNWQTFNMEQYGFSIKIPPDFVKEEQKEILLGGQNFEGVSFGFFKDEEEWLELEIMIIIEENSKTAKTMRSYIFDAFKSWPNNVEKAFYPVFALSSSRIPVISKEKVIKGNCIGVFVKTINQPGRHYQDILALTSLNFEDFYVTINFSYRFHPEKIKPMISEIIQTIECIK